jgi:hypothetical protein
MIGDLEENKLFRKDKQGYYMIVLEGSSSEAHLCGY